MRLTAPLMTALLASTLFAAAALSPSQAQSQPSAPSQPQAQAKFVRTQAVMPQPFTATYDVSYRGVGAGSLTFKLSRDPATGRYIYETTADPSLLARIVVSSAAVERSVMEVGPQGVRPIEWQLDDGRSSTARDGKLNFDWQNNVVTGVVEDEQIELPLEPGVQDRMSMQIDVVTSLLRGEEPGTIPLIDDNRVKRYSYVKIGPAVAETEFGKLDAVLYESTREGSNRQSRFWLVPKMEYLAARAEQIRKGKVETVMVLRSFEQH